MKIIFLFKWKNIVCEHLIFEVKPNSYKFVHLCLCHTYFMVIKITLRYLIPNILLTHIFQRSKRVGGLKFIMTASKSLDI